MSPSRKKPRAAQNAAPARSAGVVTSARLEHGPGGVEAVEPPCRQSGHVARQRRARAGVAAAGAAAMHAGRGQILGLPIAVQREQDLRRLATQLGGVGRGQSAAGQQAFHRAGAVQPRRRPDFLVQRRVALQRGGFGLGFLGHRRVGVVVDDADGAGRQGRHGLAARHAHHQQIVDRPRVRQVRPAVQPVAQLVGAGPEIGAEVPLGQDVAEHRRAQGATGVEPRGLPQGLRNVAARLQREDAPDAYRLAGRQRSWQPHRRAVGRCDAGNGQRHVVARGEQTRTPRLRRRPLGPCPGEKGGPGDQCRGGWKAGECSSDRSHALPVARPALRHNP